MNADIVFIVPAVKPRIKDESIGTLILAKKAILAGFKVAIVRYWDSKYSPKTDYSKFKKDLIQIIFSYNPKIVSFYCRCEEYHICIDLSKTIKEWESQVSDKEDYYYKKFSNMETALSKLQSQTSSLTSMLGS